MSFSDSAGTLTRRRPGRLMPLLSLTGPPTTTAVCTSVPSTVGHLEAHLAVVDQDLVAGGDVAGQPVVRRRADRRVARARRGW